jgi:RND family efflux transporter MFP subunit
MVGRAQGIAARCRAIVALPALGAGLLAAACGSASAPPPPARSAPVAGVSIGAESVLTAAVAELRTGPLLSGALRPAREAMVRAKMSGSVLEVRAEEGQAVQRGAFIARIEARPLQDALISSQSAVRSAEQSLSVAEREADRTASLVKGGALAERDLELARSAVTGAQAQVADARARLASVRQQLDDAVVTAPISGVLSGRPVNAGDVVSPGTLLATIIDPSSMLLEASVQSDALASLKINAPVEFEVRGYPGQTFEGHIERIAPAADPVTRQVNIFVDVPNTRGQLVAGLFAEGRVTSERRQAILVPATAVDTSGQSAWVLRLRDGKAERVPVRVGVRDDRSERIEILSGVAAGDVLLGGAARAITPGTPVTVTGAAAAPRK